MSYGGYSYFTRKQCNVIFKAFKRGVLKPPRDCRGRVKREGFVYGFEGRGFRHGFHLDRDEELLNTQIAALNKVCSLVCEGEHAKAQAILDGVDEQFNHDWLPVGVAPEKMWRSV